MSLFHHSKIEVAATSTSHSFSKFPKLQLDPGHVSMLVPTT